MSSLHRERLKEIFYVLPLALIIGITPLIVRYKKIELGRVVASYWIRDTNTDFFSYYKMWVFLIFILLALISFYIYNKKGNSLKRTFYYLPTAVYMFMIVISALLSECQYTSLFGFPDRYEGMPVLLGYMLIVIITINLINSKRQIKFLLTVLLISAVIIGIIGLYQFFGMDFFQSYIAQKLMIPTSGYEEIVSKLNFRFDKNNLVYATLYNPNYVGSYFAMLFSLTFVMYIFAGNREKKILLGAVNLLMFANWLGSLSRAGMLGGIISFLILILLLRNEIIKRWKSVIIIFICFAVIFTYMDIHTGGKISGEFISFGEETKMAVEGEEIELVDINVKDGYLRFILKDNTLNINFDENDNFIFQDQYGNNLEYLYNEIQNGKYIQIDDGNFKNFKFRLFSNKKDEIKLFEIYFNNNQVNFLVDPIFKNYWIQGIKGNMYPLTNAESWGFNNKQTFASGRGYIWSRSLPLLRKTILRGFGPDTYAIYFPQGDCIGKFKAFGTTRKIVDKPHNMYLQIALNTGLLSLLAVLILFMVYFIRSLKIYWSVDKENYFARAGISIFAAFIGYVIAGLFNDSVISVAPVFWTLLGIGIAVELKLDGYNNYSF